MKFWLLLGTGTGLIAGMLSPWWIFNCICFVLFIAYLIALVLSQW